MLASIFSAEAIAVWGPLAAYLLSAAAQKYGIPFHPFGINAPTPGTPGTPAPTPVSGSPAVQPAAPGNSHPILSGILNAVVTLIAKQQAGQPLSASEHADLRAGLPVAQQAISQAAAAIPAVPAAPSVPPA